MIKNKKNDENKMKSMLMNHFKNIEEDKKNEIKHEEKVTIEEMAAVTKIDYFYSEIEENEICKFLQEQSLELFKIRVKNVIEFGRIFSNVFEKLSKEGSKHEGLYTKWLEANDFSARSALRYRKRYELYSKANDEAKKTISILPQNIIEIILGEEEKYITLLNDGIQVKEIIEITKEKDIIENKAKEKEEVEIIDYSFKEYKNILKNIDEKVETLKEKEKLEIKKYLDKINKILKKK